MYETLILKFDNGYELEWKISNTKVAQTWAQAVKDSLGNLGMPSSCHLQNFAKNPKQYHYDKMKSSYLQLKENIKDIPELVEVEDVDLDYLNKLHAWFAKNETTHLLLNDIHMNLHAVEGLFYNPNVYPLIQVSWDKAESIYFNQEDYLEFTNKRSFGDIELTYHHIGKSPFAVFMSNDILSKETLVPYTRYCSNFFIWFGCNYDKEEEQVGFWKWYDKNYQWFKENLGWEQRDPRIGLGSYKVASFVSGIDNDALLDNIPPGSKLLEIILK